MERNKELPVKINLERSLTLLLARIHASGDAASLKVQIMTDTIIYCLNDLYHSIAHAGQPYPAFDEYRFIEARVRQTNDFFVTQVLQRAHGKLRATVLPDGLHTALPA